MKNLLYIWYNDLCDMLHDEGILIFVVFVPLAYPLLYAWVYTNEVVRDVPAVVVDDCNSERSRLYIKEVDATAEAAVVAHATSMREAQGYIERGEAYGIIHIPKTFDLDISRGDQTTIGLYCDLSSLLYYKGLLLANTNVSLDMNRDIKVKNYLPGTTEREEEVNKMPIDYDYVTLYNPQSGFSAFLIPPVLMLIIQQTLILGIGMHMGRTRENYMGCIFPLRKEYKSPLAMVLGRGMVYFLLYIVMAFYMFCCVNKWFGLPQMADGTTFLCMIVPYLLSCIAFSEVMSILVYRREDCIMLFVFVSVPLLFLSGLTWPHSSIPPFWRALSQIFPSTYGMNAYVGITAMGASVEQIMPDIIAMLKQTVAYLLIACFAHRVQIYHLQHRYES